MHTVGHVICQETWKNGKWDTKTLTLSMAGNTQNRGKLEMHNVGSGISWENWKRWKKRNTYCRKWNLARNIEKRENEKCIL